MKLSTRALTSFQLYTHWRKTGERSIVAHFVLLVERPVCVSTLELYLSAFQSLQKLSSSSASRPRYLTFSSLLLKLSNFSFSYSGVQGEESLMVERESKAHCLSNLADEKW